MAANLAGAWCGTLDTSGGHFHGPCPRVFSWRCCIGNRGGWWNSAESITWTFRVWKLNIQNTNRKRHWSKSQNIWIQILSAATSDAGGCSAHCLRPLHFYSSSVGESQGLSGEKRAAKNSGKKVTFSHGFLITQNGVQVMLFPCATVSWIFRLRLGVCPNRSWWMHVLLHWWHHRAMVHFCPLS